MTIKKSILALLILTTIFLVACTNTSKPTSTAKDEAANQGSKTSVFTSETDSFSVELPEFFQKSLTSQAQQVLANRAAQDTIQLEAGYSQYYLNMDRYLKADIATSLEEFARYFMKNSTKNEELQLEPTVQMEVAGKTGIGFSKELTHQNQEQIFLFFAYEDGDFYKFIRSEASLSNKKSAQGYMETAIASWKDLPVTPHYDLSQNIALPTVGMSLNLPSDWTVEPRADGDTDTLDYFNKDKTFYVSLFGRTIDQGQTINLAELVAHSATELSSNATTHEVTIGSHTGYLIQGTSILDTVWSNTLSRYLFLIDNRLISIYFDIPSGQMESFRPTIEAIVSSLQ